MLCTIYSVLHDDEENHSRRYTFSSEEIKLPFTIANGDQKRLYNNTVSTVLYARDGAALRALLLR